MKRIIFILWLIVPCLCWGQSADTGTSLKEVLENRMPSNNIIKQDTGKAIPGAVPSINNALPKITFIVDGKIVNNSELVKLDRDDIESITLLKDSATMHIYGNTPPRIIVIMTKPIKKECIKITDDMKRAIIETTKVDNSIITLDKFVSPILQQLCFCENPKEEYEVIVFDAGFDSFLATQRSKDFYSEGTLKAKNVLMVNEWNSRHRQPMQYNPNIYEVSIDYDPKTDYGLEVEYQLHMFFRYMEKANSISLIGDYYAAN